MKKIIFLAAISVSLLNAFEIHKSNEFTKEVEPTKMSMSILASIDDKSQSKIQSVFKRAILGSQSEKICTNGSYRISPRYTYKQQKRTFIGYQGSITFTCEFTDSTKLDRVISKLDSINQEKDKLKLTLNPIKWIVDRNTVKQTNKILELEALNYAKTYNEYLTEVYETTCSIKEVSLNAPSRPNRIVPVYAMARDMKSETTKPIKSNHTLKYSASYKFECK